MITPKRQREKDDILNQLPTKRGSILPSNESKELDNFQEYVKTLIQTKQQYIHNLVHSIKTGGTIYTFNIYITIPSYMVGITEKITHYYSTSYFKRTIINHIYKIINDTDILFVSFLNEDDQTFKLRFSKNNHYY